MLNCLFSFSDSVVLQLNEIVELSENIEEREISALIEQVDVAVDRIRDIHTSPFFLKRLLSLIDSDNTRLQDSVNPTDLAPSTLFESIFGKDLQHQLTDSISINRKTTDTPTGPRQVSDKQPFP